MDTGIIRGSQSIIGELPRIGTRQLLEGYNAFPWLRAVVDKISDIAGSVDWTVSVAKKGSTEATPLLDHPLVAVLNGGNAEFSGLALRQLLIKYLLLASEFYCMIERNEYGMPIGLWPVPPSWVIYSPTFRSAPGATYKLQFRQWHAIIPATEMIHIYEPNPIMPYGRGVGRGIALGDELETDEYAAKHMKMFFANSARPDLLISSADSANPMGKDTADRLEQKWSEKLQGWWKNWKPYFVHGGSIRVDKISASPAELDFTTIRKFNRDVIIQMYGLPPECLGILDNSNRATIDAAEFFLTKHICVPRLSFVRAGLTHQLVPQFDKKLMLGYANPVQIDKQSRLEIMKSNPPAFKIDETRAAADLPPLANGAGLKHILPINMQLIDVETGEVFVGPQDPQDPDQETDPPETETPDAKSLRTKELSDQEWRKLSRAADLLSTHPSLLLSSAWALVVGQLSNMAQSFGDAEFMAFGAPEDQKWMLDASTADYIKRWDKTRGLMLDQTTGAQVAEVIRNGLDANTSVEDIKGQVRAYFADLGARLDAISVTETGMIASVTQLSAFKQLGVKGKEWLSQRDAAVRPTHLDLDGTQIPLTSRFVSKSGATAEAPRQFNVAEEDINCRCFLIPTTLHLEDSAKDARWKTLDNEVRAQEIVMRKTAAQVFARQLAIALAAMSSK